MTIPAHKTCSSRYGCKRDRNCPARTPPLSSSAPIRSTVAATGCILILALLFELEALAIAANFILLVVFILVNLSLIRIKRTEPAPEDIRTYPAIVPWLGFLFSLGVLIFQCWQSIADV